MKPKSLLRYTCILLLGTLCHTFPVAAAESLFSVKVEPEKQIYLKGEPVALIMTITYLGAEPVDVPHPSYRQGYEEVFEIQRAGRGDFLRLVTAEEAEAELANRGRAARRLHFDPGVAVKRTNWYQCWPKVGTKYPEGLVFPEASEYAIRGSVLWQAATNAAEASVTVMEPSSLSDKQAYEWMLNSGSLCHLAHLWMYTLNPNEYPKHAARFRELRQKYPDSVYEAFVTRTYMSASNALARGNAIRFLDLLGDKPSALTRPR